MDLFSCFNWRVCIFKSKLPANAKYLAQYLSTWMDAQGNNCFPSTKRIAGETGLSEPTVIKYLQVLAESGWVHIQKKGVTGQGWNRHSYFPDIPQKALNQFKQLAERTKTDSERHLNSEEKALKELYLKQTVKQTVEDNICVEDSTRANGVEFELFWEHWPVKRNKKAAKIAFDRKKFSKEDVAELIADVKGRKARDTQWKRGFIPHCSTYLNGERWEDECQ